MKPDKVSEFNISRRKFTKIAGAASAGLFIRPPLFSNRIASPDQSNSKVVISAVTSYDEALLKKAVDRSFEQLGGLGDIIKPGSSVGIKINLTGGAANARNYEQATGNAVGETYWTNPSLLKVVGQAILEAGAGKLYILEALGDPESLTEFGYSEVIDSLGATFVDLNEKAPYDNYITKSTGDTCFIFSDITLNGIFNELDCLVSMPKAKQHATAGVTHGMKNLVGILPVACGLYNQGAGYRAGLHQYKVHDGIPNNNLCRVVIDLNRAVPVHLVVNDAVKTVLGSEGPWTGTGITPASFNRIITGKDPVAVDSISTSIMGFDPKADDNNTPFTTSLNYLRLASQQGLGEYDPDKIEVLDIETGFGEENTAEIKSIFNYPNPFSSYTTIQFNLQKPVHVNLKILSVQGQEIAVLLNGESGTGIRKIVWDARGFSSGIYYYHIKAGNYSVSKQMLLMKE